MDQLSGNGTSFPETGLTVRKCDLSRVCPVLIASRHVRAVVMSRRLQGAGMNCGENQPDRLGYRITAFRAVTNPRCRGVGRVERAPFGGRLFGGVAANWIKFVVPGLPTGNGAKGTRGADGCYASRASGRRMGNSVM